MSSTGLAARTASPIVMIPIGLNFQDLYVLDTITRVMIYATNDVIMVEKFTHAAGVSIIMRHHLSDVLPSPPR